MPINVDAKFPDKLQPLFTAKRYKVLYGGRGGAKSWGIARALLLIGVQRSIRVLCARELQMSLAESVHKLLSDQIKTLGLEQYYTVEKATINSKINNTEFFFEGIRANVDKVKSYEGIDICWVEEANKVTKVSWEALIPTIRKDDSEIWLSFNPELAEDETYKRFIVSPPKEAILIEINWRDNPWFPNVLRMEMEELKAKDFDSYLHVWEGKCKLVLDGAVYGPEMRKVISEGRIMRVGYLREHKVDTFWDLGKSDNTAIWFMQKVNHEVRIIDYLQNTGKDVDYYLRELQNREYIYGTTWLPHDAKAQRLGSKMSVQEQIRAKMQKVRLVPKLSVADGINAARTILPNCFFDLERTGDGVDCMTHYSWDVDPVTKLRSKNPRHDQYSDGADAFRYLAVASKQAKTEAAEERAPDENGVFRPKSLLNIPQTISGWMK